MRTTMNIGIDHGYYAIETQHFSFPAGIAVYSHEPYTLPVSYTHLDVYKRQSFCREPLSLSIR